MIVSFLQGKKKFRIKTKKMPPRPLFAPRSIPFREQSYPHTHKPTPSILFLL
jgi:hypothetical protein